MQIYSSQQKRVKYYMISMKLNFKLLHGKSNKGSYIKNIQYSNYILIKGKYNQKWMFITQSNNIWHKNSKIYTKATNGDAYPFIGDTCI